MSAYQTGLRRVIALVGVDLVGQMFLAGVGFLVDRHQPHQAHHVPHAMAATFVSLPLHVPRHLA